MQITPFIQTIRPDAARLAAVLKGCHALVTRDHDFRGVDDLPILGSE